MGRLGWPCLGWRERLEPRRVGLGGRAVLRALRAVASGFLGRSLLGRRSVLAPAGVLAPLRSTWPCAPSRLAASVAPSSVAARCSPRPGSCRLARVRWSLRAVASGCVGRSLLGRRSVLGSSAAFGQGRARLALLRPARYAPARPWPCRACAPSRRPSSVASSLPAARCSGLRSPSRRLRPLAVAARLRVALRRSLPPCPPLGARACVPLASPAPPGRGCAPSRRPSSVAPSSPAARCSGPCAARPPRPTRRDFQPLPPAPPGQATPPTPSRPRRQRRQPPRPPTANAGNADRQRWQRQRRKNDTTSSTGRNTTSSTDNDTPNVLRASAPDRVNDTANDTDYDTDNDTKHDTPYRNKNNNKNLFARACESRILEAEMPGREGSM